MIYNLTPGEQRVMRKALMRSVKVVSEGKLMTELPSYSAEHLAANYPTRTDASILSGPYTPTYIAAAEIERLNRALSDGMPKWIPVGERAPGIDDIVLASWPDSWRGPAFIDSSGDWYHAEPDEHWASDIEPTHWMPLPEAPK